MPAALALALTLGVAFPPPLTAALVARGRGGGAPYPPCRRQGERHVEVIVYGDEPAGVMTALELRQRLRQLAGMPDARITLLTSSDLRTGLGGTIARAGLAYLDRNQVPRAMWDTLTPFAPSSELYRRFLKLTGVSTIAIDPRRASRAFHAALRRERISLLPGVVIQGTELEAPSAGEVSRPSFARTQRLCVLETRGHGRLGADLFIDASLGADLAHRAGVPFQSGFGPGVLAGDALALGWIFEVEGLTLEELKTLERTFSHRLLDRADREAQAWLSGWPAYRDNRSRLAQVLLEPDGETRLLFSSTSDSADQQSPALSIAFHGEQGLRPGLREAPARLDAANIAVLPGRLSFNGLLFRNNAAQNRAVLADQQRPQNWMLPAAQDVESFFLRHGARRVHWMPELYVRSADQIAHPLRPLSAGLMARGGVPNWEALGTFTYFLDLRGGLSRSFAPAKPTFNFGYRHTLPRELSNLAVLGPAGGFGGLGEGAGRIIELNISVGQGLAIASSLALLHRIPLVAVDPQSVARLMPRGFTPYGQPSGSTGMQLLLSRLRSLVADWLPWLPLPRQDGPSPEHSRPWWRLA
ncbi:MAG: FAD-dependent oxidoreductase [Cyanobium sp.]